MDVLEVGEDVGWQLYWVAASSQGLLLTAHISLHCAVEWECIRCLENINHVYKPPSQRGGISLSVC